MNCNLYEHISMMVPCGESAFLAHRDDDSDVLTKHGRKYCVLAVFLFVACCMSASTLIAGSFKIHTKTSQQELVEMIIGSIGLVISVIGWIVWCYSCGTKPCCFGDYATETQHLIESHGASHA
jgi:hypothetical protein